MRLIVRDSEDSLIGPATDYGRLPGHLDHVVFACPVPHQVPGGAGGERFEWRSDQTQSRLLSFMQSQGAECVLVAALPGEDGGPFGVLCLASTARKWSGEWPRRFAQECARLASDFLQRCAFKRELQENIERYRQLVLGLSTTIVWEGDPDTLRLTFVNPAAEALLGYPVTQWLNDESFWVNHIHPDNRERAIAYCRQETLAGRNHQIEYRMIAADRRIVWLRHRISVATIDNGKRLLRGVMHDITQEKEANSGCAKARSGSRCARQRRS